MRKAQMGDAIQKVIDKSKIAHMDVYTRSKDEQEAEKQRREQEKQGQSVIQSILSELTKNKDEESLGGEKLADGFVRSKRNLALRIKDEMSNQFSEVEQEKTELLQKLNTALIKLDKLNTKTREMSNLLVEKIKFVRDLQKATTGGDDIENIISTQMKEEFRREQQINHRLREEIKRSEMDRLKILERIKYLSGEKQIVIMTSDGLHKTYKVTQVNIQRLLDDLRRQKEIADEKQVHVDRTRAILNESEIELAELERKLAEQRRERDEAGARTAEQQRKWDDTVGFIQSEIERKKRFHRMHVKLCSTRHLEETMQKILRRNKQITFDWMQATIVGNFKKFGAVWKLKQMFKANDTRRAKSALQRWFKISCDPVALIKVNKAIPELYEGSIIKTFFFNKWKIAQTFKQAKNLNKSLLLGKMCYKLNRYWKRRMKVNFLCWRDSLIRKNDSIRTLYKFINNQRYERIIQAFMKWRQYKESQDMNVRMLGLSISLAVNRYQTQLFSAWRQWACENKEKRHLNLRQAYKCLRINTFRNKQLKTLAIGSLSLKKTGEWNIAKQCFDAFRINAASEKYLLLNNKLQSDNKPAIQALNFKITSLQRKMNQNKQTKSTKCLINLFAKLLSSYFHHWRQQASHNTLVANTTFKMRIVKLHKDSMQRAFNMWRNGRSDKIIQMQMMEIQEMQSGNFEIEEQNRQMERVIQEKVESGKSSASKKISKLVTQAFRRNIQYYLLRWRSNIAHRSLKEDKASLILKKLYKRLVRVGFQKFKRGFETFVQEEKFEKRTKEIKSRLEQRTKRRIFNAICSFSNNHNNAKNFLRSLLKRLDKHNKKSAFSLWKDFNFQVIIEKLNEEQAQQVGNIHDLQVYAGQVGDQQNALNETNKRLQKALTCQGQKTLQKWVLRSLTASMQYYFLTWKGVNNDLKHKQKIQLSMLNHINKIKLRHSFRQWSLTKANQDQVFMQELIEQEVTDNSCLQSAIEMQKKDYKTVKDKSAKSISSIKGVQDVVIQKTGNIILKVIKMNDQNYFVSKLRASFLSWRDYKNRRKQCCSLLSRAVFMMIATRAFNEIRDHSRKNIKDAMTEKQAKKIFSLWNKCLLKRGFNKWRVSQYHNIKEQIIQTTQSSADINQDFDMRKTRAREHFVQVKSQRRRKQQLQLVFDQLRKKAHNQRELRIAKVNMKENNGTYLIRRALIKWKARKEITIKMRNICAKGKLIKKQLNLRSVFVAWKREFQIVKRMCCRVDQTLNALVNLRKHESFDIIRRYAVNRYQTIKTRKEETKNRLISIFTYYHQSRLRRAYEKMKVNADRSSDALKRFQVILGHNYANSLRRMFMKWKQKAQEIDVVDQNELEDGPVNLKNFELRQRNLNLEKMLLQDGATRNEIDKIKDKATSKFKSQIEKSLCRLLCREDKDLQLIPFCIDRWKRFTQIRKIWKRILYQCNLRQSRDTTMSSKLWAFQKWKYNYADDENKLMKIPFPTLQKICISNVEKLELIADAIEAVEAHKQNLLQQRSELLKNQIGGQKLAFALIRANQERAKQTAMTRWIDGGNAILKHNIEEALQKNLDKISQMKDTIVSLEKQNDYVAEQNDTYRQGAMDGILMAKHCEDLHKDRENLSVDLADKAITIRKLLEDNSYLHNKVQQIKTNNQAVMRELAKSSLNEPPQRDKSMPHRV